MISRFGLLKRHKDLTSEQFRQHWINNHGPIAATFPNLRRYYQHEVIDNEHFGIDHARGHWDLDGFSELQFESHQAMMDAVHSSEFNTAHGDEEAFLSDLSLLICEKHDVVPLKNTGEPLIKRMTLLKRLPGISEQQFREEWLIKHAEWVSQWPNVMGYTQNLVVDRFYNDRTQSASYEAVPVDGIVEFWFRNKEEAAELYATDIVTQTQQHALEFLDEITPFFVQTRTIVNK